jgi:hypothetical protein
MVQLTDRRRALLAAALAFVQFPPQTSELRALHAWLDTWSGVGAIAVGMAILADRMGGRADVVDDGGDVGSHPIPLCGQQGLTQTQLGGKDGPWGREQEKENQAENARERRLGVPRLWDDYPRARGKAWRVT